MDRDYDKELKQLAEQMSIRDSSIIEQGVTELKHVFSRMDTLYILYHYLNERDERGIINVAPKGVRILYAKLANCLIGIIRLLQAGLVGPAAIVLRCLFETSVHLRVMLMDNVQERSALFEDFLFIERSRLTYITDEEKTKNKIQLEKVRANYHPDNPKSWCWKLVPSKKDKKGVPGNPTLRDLCVHIGNLDRYNNLYDLLSKVIHPVPSYEAWLRNKDGHMDMGPLFGPSIEKTANLTIAYAGEALVSIINFLKPEDEMNLKSCVVALIQY